MARGKLDFNTHFMQAAGDSSGFAGEAAKKAASRLADAGASQGIFGDFDAANAFHSALVAARDDHVQRAHDHDARLRDISGKAHSGAWALTETDGNSADAIGSAGDEISAAES
ncbi:DUF2563 family protein [Mycolicibacterium fortuitum]|uniref:DUF2563 family protein n=1 Tax=Mycolicibacterium TaxID=1866885 RepID=UPI0007EDA25B|nr:MULTISPECIES: DUF2563 family protein [Mycolicibacterium]OBK12926.1 hypothetical protein A5637_20420 [Mycolicibacterium fortuitum]